MGKRGSGYGSEDHLQRMLADDPAALSAAILHVIGAAGELTWLPGPARRGGSGRTEWQGVNFLGGEPDFDRIYRAWRAFWPSRNHHWDAVGKLAHGGTVEWLLVEAKGHLHELKSSCAAYNPRSVSMIQAALAETKQALGVPAERDWLKGYYQYCNRLAALHFLTRQGIPARLVLVYFVGDRSGPGRRCPQSAAEWREAMDERARHVGLPPGHSLAGHVHTVFVPVAGRDVA
jgi:hypothetical protein